MKLKDVKPGMTVRGQNSFGLLYRVTQVYGRKVEVFHCTGRKIMRGGKLVDEVFSYRVSPRILTPAEGAALDEARMVRDAVASMIDSCASLLALKWRLERAETKSVERVPRTEATSKRKTGKAKKRKEEEDKGNPGDLCACGHRRDAHVIGSTPEGCVCPVCDCKEWEPV